MSIPLSPLDKCPFDAPDPSCRRRLNSADVDTSGGTDHPDYEAELVAQVGDYDVHGPFATHEDVIKPF